MTSDGGAPAPDAFAAFALSLAAIAAVPKRLDKAARLATYLEPLGDADLRRAVRFTAGHIFPLWDRRRLSVGQSTMLTALQALCGRPLDDLRREAVACGDLGALAATLCGAPHVAADADGAALPLAALESTFVALVAARTAAAKAALLRGALARLRTPDEAAFFVRLCGGELRIGLQEGAVEDALARLAQVSVAAVQRANMYLGDIGATAVLARHNMLEAATLVLFAPLKFMLATAVDDAEAALLAHGANGAHCLVEDKYDGIRVQVHLRRDGSAELPQAAAAAMDAPEGGKAYGMQHGNVRVALFTRTLGEITSTFADLVPPLAALVAQGTHRSLLFDGELLALSAGQVLPFARLQRRLGRKSTSVALQAEVPVALVAFDLLLHNEAPLLEQPLKSRQALLHALLPELFADARTAVLWRTPSTLLPTAAPPEQLETLFLQARARGNEGLVIKDPAASYRPGRRGRDWLKLKRPCGSLDVVITSAEVGFGRRRKWLSDYTFAVRKSASDATLLTLGKAYSGLTDAEIEALTVQLRADTVQTFGHGKVHQVTPRVVLEVTFDRVQKSPRHKSGYALRFPRIVRIRHDKGVEAIDTLAAVEALAQP